MAAMERINRIKSALPEVAERTEPTLSRVIKKNESGALNTKGVSGQQKSKPTAGNSILGVTSSQKLG